MRLSAHRIVSGRGKFRGMQDRMFAKSQDVPSRSSALRPRPPASALVLAADLIGTVLVAVHS
jgi:hypothetical protein